MRLHIVIILCVLYLVISVISTVFATEPTKVYWLTDDINDLTKPKSITENISVGHDTLMLLMANLPKYQFQNKFVQNPSIDHLLNSIPNSCTANRLKTLEQPDNYLYSLPINLYLGLHLYYKKNDIIPSILPSMLNDKGKLTHLSSLFQHNHDYLLGIDNDRSFGEFLDAQLTNINEHNMIIRHAHIRSFPIAHMLFKDNVNYIIDYPFAIKNALASSAVNIKLVSLAIAGMPDYTLGHIACSNNKFGRRVIKDINKTLINLYKTKAFYKAHSRYLSEIDLANFNRAYEEAYRSKIPVKTSAIILDF